MSLSRPTAKIATSGQTLTAAEAALLRARVSLSVLGTHDAITLTVWRSSKLADLATGDEVAIALGEVDDEVDVTKGTLAARLVHGSTIELEVLAPTAALSQHFVSKTYLRQTVADIVNDLAGSVAVDQVDGDAQLAAYAVDDRRPAWSHLRDLADLVDADLGAADDGSLRFVAITGGSPVAIGAQSDVLAWGVGARTAAAPSAVAAYGASSEAGADQWHWIHRSPSPSGDGVLRLVGGFRAKEPADQLRTGLEARAARRALGGRVVLVGHPDLRPGDVIQASDAPGGDPGALRILSIEHVLDPLRGFTSSLLVEGAGGGGGPGGLL
ncbi:MAG TPA: hypothetical protein VFT22_19635 [Kofleriaceae bacterium]|nr:hypothetical protein [Kofleriaceae bacterium]